MRALPGVEIDHLPRGLPTDSHYPRVSASAGADYPYSQVFCIRGCYPRVPKMTDDGYGVSASEIPTGFYPRMTDNTRGQLYLLKVLFCLGHCRLQSGAIVVLVLESLVVALGLFHGFEL